MNTSKAGAKEQAAYQFAKFLHDAVGMEAMKAMIARQAHIEKRLVLEEGAIEKYAVYVDGEFVGSMTKAVQ